MMTHALTAHASVARVARYRVVVEQPSIYSFNCALEAWFPPSFTHVARCFGQLQDVQPLLCQCLFGGHLEPALS